MGVEGRLDIHLSIAGTAVQAVSIHSSRPVLAADVFRHRRIEECQEMLPLLFSVCAVAQACAGVRACEGALGLPSVPAVECLRERLVHAETVREHLWRILLDWPSFTGAGPDRAAMAEAVRIQGDLRRELDPEGTLFKAGACAVVTGGTVAEALSERLRGLLHRTVFGMPPQQWLALAEEGVLAAWAERRETVSAALFDDLMAQGMQGVGACHVAALPGLDPRHLERAMGDAEYLHRPHCAGTCRETSSLTRTRSPLLERLRAAYGNGLLVRLTARLSELAQLAGRLVPGQEDSWVATEAGRVSSFVGIGQVAAARGQLAHRVELDGECIASYRILAPTEWNFHPRGVVARTLGGLRGAPGQLERQARLLINAIDPCVGYDLTIG